MTNTIQKIAFIIAMEAEASPFIEHYQMKKIEGTFSPHLPFIAYQANYNGLALSLVLNGKDDRFGVDNIGTQAAVLATHLAIEKFNPDLIINTGTAGGFKEKGMAIGDVVVAQGKAYFHDRRIPIPVFDKYGLGGFPLPDWSALINDLSFKKGLISTGNAFDFTPEDQRIMSSLDASLKDMEAASVAWICHLNNIPLLILKSVTDYVDLHNNNEAEFTEHFSLATKNLKHAIISLIDWIQK